MSRFLLRNTVRDPKFAALRKKNDSLVVLRPFIGGKPLPPAATRILVLSDLSANVLAEIEALVAIGNVEFLAVGRQGPAVDFQALRKELGHVAPVSASVTAPVAAEVVAEVVAVAEVTSPAEPEPVPVAPEASEPVEEEVSAELDAPEAPASEPAAEKVWTREELEAAKLVDLRDVLTALGGKPAGKNKAAVVDEILAAQDGV